MKLRIFLWTMALSVIVSGQASKPTANKTKFNYKTQLGVVSFAADQPPCLDIANDSLASGDKLWLVSSERPQRTARAEIVKRLKEIVLPEHPTMIRMRATTKSS